MRDEGAAGGQTAAGAIATGALPPTGSLQPTGAALAPVRARYATWLGLDREHVLADRDEDPRQIRALQLIVRMERTQPPSWQPALQLAARGCAALCLDSRCEPGGEWFDDMYRYCSGHIRKVTRRARGAHWAATADLAGLTLVDGATEVRVLVPGLAVELDSRVSRLQVGGTDVPRDFPPPDADRPAADRPAAGRQGAARLRVWLNPAVPMTLGKAMAQAGHAGMIAAALLAGTDRAALSAWIADGLPVLAGLGDPARWAKFASRLYDPARAWQRHRLLAVRDAGFTEIDPGTVTVVAEMAAG